MLLPVALMGSRWYVGADGPGAVAAGAPAAADGDAAGVPAGGDVPGAGAGAPAGPSRSQSPVVFRMLLPLCLVMAFAYIGDSTVSNWSAKYLQDMLGSSEELATVPYNAYMVTTLLGRAVGDLGVRRFGAVAVVRSGTVLAGGRVRGGGGGSRARGPGILGFTLLGLGLCVIVPQTFAAAGRRAFESDGPEATRRSRG